MGKKDKKDRQDIVEEGGIQVFEVRVVQWFDRDGRSWTSTKVDTLEGHTPPELFECLGALEVAKSTILEMHEL